MHSTCLQLDMKTIDFTGCAHGFEWCLIGVHVRNPLCVEHFTNLPQRKKKQQHLAIFCLRNGIFGDMAIDQVIWDTWLLRTNVLRDLVWLQVDWSIAANETTLGPVFHFRILGTKHLQLSLNWDNFLEIDLDWNHRNFLCLKRFWNANFLWMKKQQCLFIFVSSCISIAQVLASWVQFTLYHPVDGGEILPLGCNVCTKQNSSLLLRKSRVDSHLFVSHCELATSDIPEWIC